jgi:4-carboxymuconolactone decarboxylase
MPRIPYLPIDEMAPEYREMLKGRFNLNIYRMLPHAPTVATGFLKMGNAILRESELDPQLRELAILRVGILSGASYEVHQHTRIAKKTGLSEAKIAAIAQDPQGGVFSNLERLVLRYTDEVIHNVKASDALFRELHAMLNNRMIVELTLTIGYYMAVSRFLENFEVDIEPRELISESPAKYSAK